MTAMPNATEVDVTGDAFIRCEACAMPLYDGEACALCVRDAAYAATMAALTAPKGSKGGYTVRLASVGNPDYRQDPRCSLPGVPRQTIRVVSLRAASEACRAYINHHELGGGNWSGGEIKQGGKVIGSVSYNGRVWGINGKEIALGGGS